MRRSYASVAKEDKSLSSSLPSSLLSGQTTIIEKPCNDVDAQKTMHAEETSIPINIQSGSILARTRNRLYQATMPTSSSIISPPPTKSQSCSPPQRNASLLMHANSMHTLSSNSSAHLSVQHSHHQQHYVYGKPANSPPTNQIQHQQTGASYDKRIVLYKTEMCRTFEDTGICRYGTKCQFAHDRSELRQVARHPRYKTEICKTYWQLGTCPYGKRCCFIHSESEVTNMTHHGLNNSSPMPIHNFLSTIPRASRNQPPSEDEIAADEMDMESMMEHLPTDMLSML